MILRGDAGFIGGRTSEMGDGEGAHDGGDGARVVVSAVGSGLGPVQDLEDVALAVRAVPGQGDGRGLDRDRIELDLKQFRLRSFTRKCVAMSMFTRSMFTFSMRRFTIKLLSRCNELRRIESAKFNGIH